MSARSFFGIGYVICLWAVSAHANSWNQFRGPMGNGVAEEDNLPTTWSAQSGIVWSVPLPRRGNSSPVLAARRIFLTTQTAGWDLFVLAFDAKAGKPLWKQKVGRGVLPATSPRYLYERIHNVATPTPAATSSGVVAFFGTGLLICLDAASGREI